jgi:hypothetical protein
VDRGLRCEYRNIGYLEEITGDVAEGERIILKWILRES